jgi:CBS domain-containing protein
MHKLARTMTLEYFPKDTVILSAGHRTSETLYIVQKGALKLALRTQVGSVVERSGNHKEQLDLKSFGSSPIVNAARLFVLDAGVEDTNTVERLAALQSLGYEDVAILRELQETFEFLTLLRLENELRQARAGEPLSHYISPGKLSHLQRNMLKEAFHTIGRVHSLIDHKFRTAVWSQLGQ